jgi:hypothetical protein
MASESRPKLRQRRSSQLSAACLCAWLCAASPIGLAQTPQTPPSAAERETARALMQEGDQLTAAGNLQEALVRYTAAHALVHIPTTGLEVARTQAKLGRLVEARGLALEISGGAATKGEPRLFASARSAAADLARELEPRIPSVRTQVSPANAQYALTIDGVTLPSAARMIAYRTNPGLHSVLVAAPGYVSQRKEVKLSERQAATLTIALTPAPPIAATGPVPTPAPAARR